MFRYDYGDLAWLAVDSAGHVGVFTTGGKAPIPSAVLDKYEVAQNAEELVEQLSPIGNERLIVRLSRPDDYIGFARRGLFAFDWADVHRIKDKTGCYEIIAKPECARLAHDLGAELEAIARLVTLDAVSFVSADKIPVDQMVPCETG